jgi:hypothetical protein
VVHVSLVLVTLVFPRSEAAASTSRGGMASGTSVVPAVVFLSACRVVLLKVSSEIGEPAEGELPAVGLGVGTFELLLVDENESDRFLATVRADRCGAGAAVRRGGLTWGGRDVRGVHGCRYVSRRELRPVMVSESYVAGIS